MQPEYRIYVWLEMTYLNADNYFKINMYVFFFPHMFVCLFVCFFFYWFMCQWTLLAYLEWYFLTNHIMPKCQHIGYFAWTWGNIWRFGEGRFFAFINVAIIYANISFTDLIWSKKKTKNKKQHLISILGYHWYSCTLCNMLSGSPHLTVCSRISHR